jgi:hypothetical protein
VRLRKAGWTYDGSEGLRIPRTVTIDTVRLLC